MDVGRGSVAWTPQTITSKVQKDKSDSASQYRVQQLDRGRRPRTKKGLAKILEWRYSDFETRFLGFSVIVVLALVLRFDQWAIGLLSA